MLARGYRVLLHSTTDTNWTSNGFWNDGFNGLNWHDGTVNDVSLLWSEHSCWGDEVSLLRRQPDVDKDRPISERQVQGPEKTVVFLAP